MGVLSSISAAAGPLPVARIVSTPIGPALAAVPATLAVNHAQAVVPAQAKTASERVAPELPHAMAAKLAVQNAEDIELDNIPFTNDGAVLLDDLPLPEKVAPLASSKQEVAMPSEPDLAQVATRGYLASREAATHPIEAEAGAPPQPEAAPEPVDPLFSSGD